VHTGKTAGSSLSDTLQAAGIPFTEYELNMGPQLKAELPMFDTFIISTRDPLSRVVSAWNFEHLIGGGDPLPQMEISMAENSSMSMLSPYEYVRQGENVVPPYRVGEGLTNVTQQPLEAAATYFRYPGAPPTGPKPLASAMYLDCFPQLPGGLSQWAQALQDRSKL
jgi:hypothetical protein